MAAVPVATDRDYPLMIAEINHVEPAPRRVRAMLGGEQIFDTTRARYVWEWPYYPQYYIPAEDIDPRFLVDEHHEQHLGQGTARRHGLRAGSLDRPGTVRVFGAGAIDGVGRARPASTGPRSMPGTRRTSRSSSIPAIHMSASNALRSHRHVRVSLEGVTLAETTTPVLVFETGLPTRYYFDRTDADFAHLVPTGTQTACPYKGVTSGYWSVRTGDTVREGHQDLAWAYDYPTRQLQPIAGLVAFYNEKTDIDVNGLRLSRARTHFFK